MSDNEKMDQEIEKFIKHLYDNYNIVNAATRLMQHCVRICQVTFEHPSLQWDDFFLSLCKHYVNGFKHLENENENNG